MSNETFTCINEFLNQNLGRPMTQGADEADTAEKLIADIIADIRAR